MHALELRRDCLDNVSCIDGVDDGAGISAGHCGDLAKKSGAVPIPSTSEEVDGVEEEISSPPNKSEAVGGSSRNQRSRSKRLEQSIFHLGTRHSDP